MNHYNFTALQHRRRGYFYCEILMQANYVSISYITFNILLAIIIKPVNILSHVTVETKYGEFYRVEYYETKTHANRI